MPSTVVHMSGALDPRGGWTADRCSIARALDVVSTRSSFLILREAFYGTTRFDEFVDRVGISDAVAAARLRGLVDEGLLVREAYRDPGQRTRQLYRLTAKGTDLLPALVALQQWGDRWVNQDGGVQLLHRECGARVGVRVSCAHGHDVEAGDLDLAVNRRPVRSPRLGGL